MECICIKCVPFESLRYLIDDSVVCEGASIGCLRIKDNKIIQLDHLALLDADPKIQWRTVSRAKHNSYNFICSIHISPLLLPKRIQGAALRYVRRPASVLRTAQAR